MNFDEAINYILEYEGGFVDNPHDKGGVTNFGISQRQYPRLDIKNLTKEKAKQIYKFDYWDRVRCDLLKPSIRLIVFDCAVNQGIGTAIKFLQKTVGVKADGVIGPFTLKALESTDDVLFIDQYSKIRLAHYVSLNDWMFFGRGWSKRLLEISLLCAFMSDGKAKDFLIHD